MEFNEPLNLSIKKRPVAVVTPSSSNKTSTQSSTATVQLTIPTLTLSTSNNAHGNSAELSPIECSSNTVNTVDTLPESNRDQLLYEINQEITDEVNSESIGINKDSTVPESTHAIIPIHSETSGSIDTVTELNLVDLLYGRPRTPTANSTISNTSNSTKYAGNCSKSLSIAEATAALTTYLGQQQSLDIAKMHLERYLKVTNQYLHTTLDSANMTSNEQINHLIRTNILTNKIAANNLISIINKLLEQNIISEYYFKHASRLLMHEYQDQSSGSNIDIDVKYPNDTDPSDIYKLIPQPIIDNNDNNDKQNGDQENGTDDENPNPSIDSFDYDEKIKKETIPIHSNPFMSYLTMQLSKGFEQTTAAQRNTIHESTTLSSHGTSNNKKTKQHHRSDQINNNRPMNNNNNYNKPSATVNQMVFDLSLNINNQRF